MMVIQELRREYKLDMLLGIAQLPRSTFYYHSKQQSKEDKYAHAKAEIAAIYHENKGRYGYRRVTDELHNRGIMLNHKTVQRLMKELGLICRVRMKKYRSYRGERGKTADNELNREIAATILEEAGVLVVSAENGREAADIFAQSEVGSFDAILMDIMMPVLDGLQAAEEIRRMKRADAAVVPIFAVTANAFEEDRKKTAAVGMNGHLTKPLDIKLLVEEQRIVIKLKHRSRQTVR